jgi:kynurenine formamidase
MCTPDIVDTAFKDKIAALDAKYRVVSSSPFGKDDEIGMLNLITPESRKLVLSEADYSKTFDLAVDFFVNMPSWTAAGDPPFQIWMSHTPNGTIVDDPMKVGRHENELVSYSGDCIAMYTHCGTHIDTLNHFGYQGKIWNGFTARDHLGSRHWEVCGADKFPPIIARGVLIDVAGLKGISMLEDNYGIGAQDIKDALQAQNTELRPGDVVLVRTGRMTVWPEVEAYVRSEPGINREAAEFLARAGAIVIGGDNLALEQMPGTDPDNWQVVHTYLFAEAGIPIMEVVNLEELAAEKVYEFAFVGACLRIRGATGSPIRPIAMPLRR